MKNRTEKQHYIPNKSYLDYFNDKTLKPNALWVYMDKKQVIDDASIAQYKNITPINLCKESYLYETPRLPVNAIEKALAEIEGNYKKVLDNKIIPQKRLTESEKLTVSYFLSTLEVRTPLNKENTDKFIADIKEKVVHLEEAHGNGQKSQLHQELEDSERQNIMFTQTLAVAFEVNRFGSVDMLFLSPQFDDEESYFITSDFPVTMVDFTLENSFYPPTPMDATVEVLVPLTPKIALFVNNIGLNGYKKIDYNFVREINNRVLRRSNKYIISPKKFDKDFSHYIVKRTTQSFVLWALSDGLRKKRRNRMDILIKKKLIEFVKKIINTSLKICSINLGETKMSIDCVELSPHTMEEYNWFIRVIEMLGKNTEHSQSNSTYSLTKSISTKGRSVNIVKILKPSILRIKGCVLYKVENYDNFKNTYKDKPGFIISNVDNKDIFELKDSRFNILVHFN